MTSNVQRLPVRDYPTYQVHYIRRAINHTDNGILLHLGVLPKGAQIIQSISGVYVREAFNAGTSNVLDIGTDEDSDYYATDLALGTVGFAALDEAASATNGFYVSEDMNLTCTVQLSGTAATAGLAEVVVAYTIQDIA